MIDPQSWVEISRSALQHNIAAFRGIIPKRCLFMAVVKSNAYGHGLPEVVRSTASTVDWFGVANFNEALAVRLYAPRSPILVLGYFSTKDSLLACRKNISLGLTSLKQIDELSRLAKKFKSTLNCHLKLDVGTSRVGLIESDLTDAIRILRRSRRIRIQGIYSHFADSENPNQSFTDRQNKYFNQLFSRLKPAFKSDLLPHIACSASTIANPKTHLAMVRIGTGLYGLWPDTRFRVARQSTNKGFSLKPVLTWKTRVFMTKRLVRGTTVGYGRSYRALRSIRLVILPIGYFEGYDRRLSNSGQVLIGGKKLPVVGRVCMNLLLIDGTRLPNVQINDEAVLIGRQGRGEVGAEDIARLCQTIPYEITTRLSPSLPRHLLP